LKQTLRSSDKLKLKSEFSEVRDKGRKITSRMMIMLYIKSIDSGEPLKCGVICSRKFDKRAVRRNRARRLIFESFRLLKQRILPCQMVFIPRREIADLRMQDVMSEMERMLAKANLLNTSLS